jgi:protein-ribulosamine 3-kinase
MFEAEARGLSLLAHTQTVRVPQVYGFAESSPEQPAFIIMEWLERGSGEMSQSRLGEQIAELHRQGTSPQEPPAFGLDRDNYLGFVVQVNRWEANWPRFFGECRLRPQMELAQSGGRLPPERRRRLERVIDRLESLLSGVNRRPALTHGDLWGGNVIPGPDGLALIDPAVYYADRETEIAYTELFHGFPSAFYEGYQSAWPLEPGYSERRELYNLYHLVNHLNHFGESYGPQVDAVLRRYGG